MWTKGSLRHHVDELLLAQKQLDPKSHHSVDQGIAATSCRRTVARSKATRSQITSQFGPRDRCDIMSTNCCSLKGNWVPNHITVWTKGSLRHHVTKCCSVESDKIPKRQDPKSDRCLDQGIVAFAVLNTKLDAMHDDFMSRVVDDRRQQDSKFEQFWTS